MLTIVLETEAEEELKRNGPQTRTHVWQDLLMFESERERETFIGKYNYKPWKFCFCAQFIC
jgi:hypothetical protein